MSATFEEVQQYLEEKEIGDNEAPKPFVEGGRRYTDMSDRTYYNTQIVLIAHEIPYGDTLAESDRRGRISEAFGLEEEVGSFSFDSREDLVSVLDQIAEHYEIEIDSTQVIQSSSHGAERTVYILFLPIIEMPYFE